MKARESLLRVVEKVRNGVLDLLFPDACIGCGAFGVFLCGQCAADMQFPVISIDDDVYAGCFYQDPLVKELIRHFKFKHRPEALASLKGKIARAFETTKKRLGISPDTEIFLVPIPLWHKREQSRGYNQAEIIAHLIAETNAHIKISPDALMRTRETAPQITTDSKDARRKNIEGCFRAMQKDFPSDAAVFVIDDIVTTGATMHEAMRMLKKSGGKRVYGFALAH